MMITLDEFEAGFRDVWRSVQNDFTHKLIDYEADLQACTYYHLRKHFGDSPRDFRILCDYHYDASEFRPDIGLELRRSKQIWITLWFKKVYDVLSREDARDLTEKMPRYQSLGAERGYFCFTAFKDSAERIRAKVNRSTKWANERHWLIIAEGFHDRNGKVTEPWSVRVV